MLNLALVGLLAGSLTLGGPDGDDKNKNRDKAAPVQEEGQSVFTQYAAPAAAPTARTIQDTYAAGRQNEMSPLRIWASYAYGEAEGRWDTAGETAEIQVGAVRQAGLDGTEGDIVSQRANVGAEIGLPVNLFGFGLSAGANLTLAKNEFQVGIQQGTPGLVTQDLESSFGLQGLKVYGKARAGAVGLHGGYVFDFGDEPEYGSVSIPGTPISVPVNSTLSQSDERDAINIGADFDYPSERFRLFGGVDYYDIQGREDDPNTISVNENLVGDDADLINWMFGLGVRFGIAELGAALQIQSRIASELSAFGPNPRVGGSAGTIAPYLKLSPPQIPASIFIKGAVQNEYTEYGLGLGGSNSIKPSIGGTIGISFGFD